jgi:hypothetical protein
MKNELLQGNFFKLDASRKGTTMMNILIIFFTQYFPRKINDLVVRISPFNQRVHDLILFSNFLFFSMVEMDEKSSLYATSSTFPKGLVVFSLKEKGIKLFFS